MRSVFVAFAIAALSGPAQAQSSRRATPPQPSPRFESRDGQVWDRIQLRYIDVRVITQAFGGVNLPTELDIYRMQMGGGMAIMGGYGAGGGFGMPGGGYGQGAGFGGGFVGPRVYGGGPVILGYPATNSVVIGPRGGGGLHGPNRMIGDPRSNSVITR